MEVVMGYYVRALDSKRNHPRWKVQFVSHRKEHTRGSKALKPKRECDVPKERWKYLGFKFEMTLEQAKARQVQLNAKLKLKLLSGRRSIAEISRRSFELSTACAFSQVFVKEIEKIHLKPTRASPSHRKCLRTAWATARKVIVAVESDPSAWLENSAGFYDYFAGNGWSISYIRRLIRIANLWGHFICRRIGRSFLPIPYPRGYERARLFEAYFRRVGNNLRKSKPLTPELLESQRPGLSAPHFNWLYLSVWAGLRPQEIDQLKDPRMFVVKAMPDRRFVLWVYQTKIVSLPSWERGKPIPLIYEEQRVIPDIVNRQEFSRPSTKVLKIRFGQNVSVYAGRKGFTDLMLGRGQPLEIHFAVDGS
jgi:hypothetical protein